MAGEGGDKGDRVRGTGGEREVMERKANCTE
jgi:hypothetical protein